MARTALSEILRNAGVEEPEAGQLEIRGADPVLPLAYRIGTAGAASLAAVGLAAARLWKLRTGRSQSVSVDTRAAAVSLRSARYLRIDGKAPPPTWNPLSGFYPVRDGGWISIHCNFPNHRDAALAVLGTPAERELAGKASSNWDGEALEDAIHARGGCAGFVRTAGQWRRHAQAQAVSVQPLLEIERIGDAPPEPLPSGNRPLSGVRVLDLTRVLAGPTCARSLAEHGADVLKITAAHLPDSGAVELDTGIGKLSARIDLRTAEGVETLRGLVRDADVFSQSYRPSALAARGFAPEALAALRPGIVCVSLSAWGSTGPWFARRGFDTIVQAVSGIAHASGDGTKPRLLPVSAIDYVSGYLMAFGAMVALERRAREGGSWLVRAGLARTGKWIVDRGLVPAGSFEGLPGDLPDEELRPLLGELDAPDGRIRHLRPVVMLSETPARWSRPPVPLGTHAPVWPARGEFNTDS
ncbi:MAG: CoA transferase [Betaproteobacteria bacterium]|nr:CoA transferase [Betaproteobacteria bacterium]